MSMPPEMAALLKELLDIPPEAVDLAARFREAGHELYLVGGAVRDALLQRRVDELDFTTDAPSDETLRLVEGWHEGKWLQGIEFGTVGVQKAGRRFEITTFRGERYDERSRKPEVVPVPTLLEDLSRRDFTVNAMAVQLPEREFIDPFGGVNDLVGKRLRTPGAPEASFSDDPLRMLRAARFVSQLELDPEPEVVEAMRSMRDRLEIVSGERIRDELSKLLASPKPSRGLLLATETGLCDVFLPEVPALQLEQDAEHRHKDVFAHTLAVVDKIAAADPGPDPDVVARLAALLHDIGKPATRKIEGGKVSFHHHEIVGAKMARKRLEALRYPTEFIDKVCHLIGMHLRFWGFAEDWTDSAVRRYVRDAGELLDPLNRLIRADCTTRNKFKARQLQTAMDRFEQRIAKLAAEEDLKRIRPPIDGNDVMAHLGIPPGPTVGEALDHLLEIRLDRGEYSREEAFMLLDDWARARGLP
ncbi:MAG TPA: CCA tRNA nucleotidyltransferase [Actinomycetota bacterium]